MPVSPWASKWIWVEGDGRKIERVYVTPSPKGGPTPDEKGRAARKERKANAQGSHTKKEWLALLALQNGICADCKQQKPLTKDHIIPLSKGGSDAVENLQGLCRECNSRKGGRHSTKF